jgi:hypothetical protein
MGPEGRRSGMNGFMGLELARIITQERIARADEIRRAKSVTRRTGLLRRLAFSSSRPQMSSAVVGSGRASVRPRGRVERSTRPPERSGSEFGVSRGV